MHESDSESDSARTGDDAGDLTDAGFGARRRRRRRKHRAGSRTWQRIGWASAALLGFAIVFAIARGLNHDGGVTEAGGPARPRVAAPLQLLAPANLESFIEGCPQADFKAAGSSETALSVDGQGGPGGNVLFARGVRFSLSAGDRWGNDPDSRSRVEIVDQTYQAGDQTMRHSYEIFVPSLTQFRTPWTIISQWQTRMPDSDSPASVSPIAIVMTDHGLIVRVARPTPQSQRADGMGFADLARVEDFPTGRWVRLDYETRFSFDGTGRLVVRIDGAAPIVDYQGPIGQPNFEGAFFRFGLFTSNVLTPVALCLRSYSREALPS